MTVEQQQMPAQGEPDFLAIGRKSARAFEQGERFGPAPQPIEDVRVLDERLGRIRCELHRACESAFGVDEPALPEVETPEALQALRPIGL